MTIFAVGLTSDKTLTRFTERAVEQGYDARLVDLGALVGTEWRVELGAEQASLQFGSTGDGESMLDPGASYYLRTVDLSPVLDSSDAQAWRMMLCAVTAFLEVTPGVVINRPGGHCHNGAKPLHEWWLAQRGFHVPASVTTSTADVAVEFAAAHGSAIVKALSGSRGTAQRMDASSFVGLDQDQGPIHLQRWIDGYDVRVHAVHDKMFAERIDTRAVDYREADAETLHAPTDVPCSLAEAIVDASLAMGLAFTGWDFRVDRDGCWWCLEANPMPGYDVYDRRCEGQITRALCEVLLHGPTD